MATKQLGVEIDLALWDVLHEKWRLEGAKRGGKREIVEAAIREYLEKEGKKA